MQRSLMKKGYTGRDHRIDRLLTSKATGIPVMVLLVIAILRITISGANIPSEMLASALFAAGNRSPAFFVSQRTRMDVRTARRRRVQDACIGGVGNAASMAIFFRCSHSRRFGYLPRHSVQPGQFLQESMRTVNRR